MVRLLDSDVLINLLRGHPGARSWSTSLGGDRMAIVGFSAIELYAGCRSTADQRPVDQLTARCQLFWPSEFSMRAALNAYRRLQLRAGVGANDTFIAFTAIELHLPLHTFNLKHFSQFERLRTLQPYTR